MITMNNQVDIMDTQKRQAPETTCLCGHCMSRKKYKEDIKMNRKEHREHMIAELRRQYILDIDPLIDMKVKIMNLTVNKFVVYPDGEIKNNVKLSPESIETINLIDQCIQDTLDKTNKAIELYL